MNTGHISRLRALAIILACFLTLTLGTVTLMGLWSMQSVQDTLRLVRWPLLGMTYVLTHVCSGKSPWAHLRRLTYVIEAVERAILKTAAEAPRVAMERFPELYQQVKEERA